MKMIHLVYVSSAARKMSEEELLLLLEQSRERNKRLNLTGMLLYADGNFIQILEGEQKNVEEVYGSIVSDARNKGNIVLLKEPIEKRTFPKWTMGFRYLTHDDLSAIEGFSDFYHRNMEPSEFANSTSKVLTLLYRFKKTNR